MRSIRRHRFSLARTAATIARAIFVFLFVATSSYPASSSAQTIAQPPSGITSAVVLVICDNRQGSGVVIQGDDGFVLTNAHVAVNIDTMAPASQCVVGFFDKPEQPPTYVYHAIIDRSVFNINKNQDFAILKLTDAVGKAMPKPFPFIKTNEFITIGSTIQVYGYSDQERLRSRSGVVQNFEDGFIRTSAAIFAGDSGGAAIDESYSLIGIPTRVVTITGDDGYQSVRYELVDIRAVMVWLDSYGAGVHERYFTHANFVRYHQSAVYIHQTDLGCDSVGRTPLASTTYCFQAGGSRLVFPNVSTYLSWFPDFSNIILVNASSVRAFRLTRNVTFEPGTLVKSITSPDTYLVVDSFGTIRWIPSEKRAQELWGPAWAKLVRDIPDEFFSNYTIGQPLGN